MKPRVSFAVLCVVVLNTTGISWGETREPFTYTQAAQSPSRTVIVGATLGNDWVGFPDKLTPDFTLSPLLNERLDVELPLYVKWIIDKNHNTGSGSPTQLNPPQPLTSFSWFTGYHDQFHVAQVAQPLNDVGYNACPQGVGLEAPQTDSFPLTADGKLRVTDTHGGIGDITRIHLLDCRAAAGDNCGELYNIIVSWDRPGAWLDWYLGTEVNLGPGTVRNDLARIPHGGVPVDSYLPVRIVQWVSSDIGIPNVPGPSPRYADASDLAYFVTNLGKPLRWGFSTETPPNSPTFQCDLSPFVPSPQIDAADLSALAADLAESCQLSKPGGGSEAAAILEWFGIAATGRMVAVGPNGEELPEYEVVDWEKNRRAVTDPYGYRKSLNSTTAAREVLWSLVKQLYR